MDRIDDGLNTFRIYRLSLKKKFLIIPGPEIFSIPIHSGIYAPSQAGYRDINIALNPV